MTTLPVENDPAAFPDDWGDADEPIAGTTTLQPEPGTDAVRESVVADDWGRLAEDEPDPDGDHGKLPG